jgi:hypothetical protein
MAMTWSAMPSCTHSSPQEPSNWPASAAPPRPPPALESCPTVRYYLPKLPSPYSPTTPACSPQFTAAVSAAAPCCKKPTCNQPLLLFIPAPPYHALLIAQLVVESAA